MSENFNTTQDVNVSDKNENQITLTIVTIDGNFKHKFNIHQKLEHVVNLAVEKLDLVIDIKVYELLKGESASPLNLELTIEQAGLVDNDRLQFRKINNGGGGRA